MTRYVLLVLPQIRRTPRWLIRCLLTWLSKGRVYLHEDSEACTREKTCALRNHFPSVSFEFHDTLPAIQETQASVYQEYLKLKRDLDKLTVFIRQAYSQEIERGEHSGFQSAVDAALHYLSKERRDTWKKAERSNADTPIR